MPARPASSAKKSSPATASPEPAERPGLRRGKTLDERRELRRAELVDAGLELFGTIGYANTTVKDVCKLAYVAPRDFYLQFENREALLVAVVADIEAKMNARFFATYRASAAKRESERVLDGFGAVVRALTEDPRAARIEYLETHAISRENEANRRQSTRVFTEALADLLADELATAGYDRQHASAICLALLGGANELIADWIASDPRPSSDEISELIVETLHILLPSKTRKARP